MRTALITVIKQRLQIYSPFYFGPTKKKPNLTINSDAQTCEYLIPFFDLNCNHEGALVFANSKIWRYPLSKGLKRGNTLVSPLDQDSFAREPWVRVWKKLHLLAFARPWDEFELLKAQGTWENEVRLLFGKGKCILDQVSSATCFDFSNTISLIIITRYRSMNISFYLWM